VPPLRLPEPGADLAALATNEAVALFVARAQAADGRFTLTAENADAVSEICARLDGLPLAIELAAARTAALPPRTLLKRLDRRLPLLTGGRRDAEERQRTLRRTIEWSYDLLANEERDLFASLGLFGDGWRLEAAQEVCTPTGDAVELLDGLDSLVEKNLVRRRTDPDGEPRFWMLETIREYARERLEANGAGAEFESKHARYFLRVINAAQADYDAPDAAVRLAKLAADYRNLEVALSWAVAQRETNLVLRGVYGLCRFWVRRGYTSDAARWLARALALEPSDAAARLRSRVEYEAAWIATYQNEFERAAGLLETCVAANRLRGPSRELVDALADQGWLACVFGDLSRGLALCEESVELGHQLDDQTLADALNNLSLVKVECGAWDEARSLQEEALALVRKLARPSAVIRSRINLAWLALVQEDHMKARALAKQVLTDADTLGDSPSTGDALFILGACTLVDDDLAEAEHCLAESLRLYREQPTRTSALALEGVAALAGASGRNRRAARLLSAAQALRGPHVLPSERLIRERMLASTLPDATEPVAEDDEPPMSLAHAVAFALGSTADQGGVTTTTV
jgi:hypothetical protein